MLTDKRMTIVLIDQYPLQRMGLAHLLSNHFGLYDLQVYNSLGSFSDLYEGENPVLVIWGLNNIETGLGLDLMLQLRSRLLSPAIVVYDDKIDSKKALSYLRTGVAGYFSRSEDLGPLAQGIDDVLKGKKYIAQEVLDAIVEEQIFCNNEPARQVSVLTNGEQRVASYLVKGLKVSSIASLLNRKMSTISTYKNRIFKKLEINNIIELKEKFRYLA